MISATSEPIRHHAPSPEPTAAFRDYFRRNKVQGTTSVSSERSNGAEEYLPEDAQQGYFSVKRIQQFLSLLYPSEHGPAVVPVRELQHRYRKVFATFLDIGKGELIRHVVSKPYLDDEHLPFVQKPESFPGENEDWDRFFDAQWRFCAPIMSYRRSVDWHERQILPFRYLKKLNEGRSGKAYLVEMHPSHDRILSDEKSSGSVRAEAVMSAQRSKSASGCNLYVVKKFHPKRKSREQWLKEVTAHVHIRTAEALKKDDGIVRFYGCFSHGDTFSIFMEWASQGNLEQLLKTPPPTDVQGIWDFWNSYLRLLTTLNCLRKITYPDSSEIQICHFDIKPSNILVFPGGTDRPHDHRFKLGDLGSSTHCVLLDEAGTPTLQTPGTGTYGAPECYRINPFTHSNLPPNLVLPPADLWSFGCIASEVATWIVRGPVGVDSYKDLRRFARSTPHFEHADAFHIGHATHPVVAQHHERLVECTDQRNLTCNMLNDILKLIEDDILQFAPEDRAQPQPLMHKAKEILDSTAHQMQLESTSTGSEGMFKAFLISQVEETPTSPLIRTSSAPKRVQRPANGYGAMMSTGKTDERPLTSRYSRSVDGRKHSPPCEGLFNKKSKLPQYPILPSKAATVSPDELPMNGNRRAQIQEPQDPLVHARAQENHGNGDVFASGMIQSPTEFPPSFFIGKPLVLSSPLTLPTAIPKKVEPAISGDKQSPNGGPVLRYSPKSALPLPRISITEARDWKDKTKQPSRWSRLVNKSSNEDDHRNWRYLSSEFENKDFLILVDDSSSMDPYWEEVGECAGLLAFCTLPYDKDGIDLRFMISPEKKNAKDIATITERIRDNRPPPTGNKAGEVSHIDTALGKVLRKYQEKVEARHKKRSTLFSPTPKLKGLLVFVLTNGMWGEYHDAKVPIVDLVRTLDECHWSYKQVGIQFIQFGDDAQGGKNLADLDDFHNPDVVDVEPYPQGNFLKMLLGSINKNFDHSELSPLALDTNDNSIAAELSTPSPRASGTQVSPSSPQPHPYVARRKSTLQNNNGVPVIDYMNARSGMNSGSTAQRNSQNYWFNGYGNSYA